MSAPYLRLRLAVDAELRKYLLSRVRPKISQLDIARACGVDKAIVTRVIKDTYPVVQESARQTRDRVRQAIAEVIYEAKVMGPKVSLVQVHRKIWPVARNGKKPPPDHESFRAVQRVGLGAAKDAIARRKKVK